MKIKGHQSFHIRRGWIYKGLTKVNANEEVFIEKSSALTDEFGIGTNMVAALKYWLEALNLVRKVRRGNQTIYRLTEIAEMILRKDPYLEEIETWELLHYSLATNEDQATTWYWFFNEYKGNKFSKDNLVNSLNEYILNTYQKEVAERSINDDISCLLNTYISKPGKTPEDNIESPFAELELITFVNSRNGKYIYTKTHKNSINIYLAYYILVNLSNGKNNIEIKKIIESPKSIGNIFNLNDYEVMDLMDSLQNEGLIKTVRTGGLDYITLSDINSPIDKLEKIYE
ncbi:DUF4007 family protein [Terrisporobacter hibernicus]|uniref:DUF4007 family protein n=1 Tax=Terrisporobacter hibernicus TaxID=2813371 RepID=A0AAX2ZEC8_9FIRM|nr:DUF4007 family protein [Terrisporobacter hibernicus]UEL46429.1 DUF4007 family protein [Terrisporobacter hibernicus]